MRQTCTACRPPLRTMDVEWIGTSVLPSFYMRTLLENHQQRIAGLYSQQQTECLHNLGRIQEPYRDYVLNLTVSYPEHFYYYRDVGRQ